jgi:hypothetical protein
VSLKYPVATNVQVVPLEFAQRVMQGIMLILEHAKNVIWDALPVLILDPVILALTNIL